MTRPHSDDPATLSRPQQTGEPETGIWKVGMGQGRGVRAQLERVTMVGGKSTLDAIDASESEMSQCLAVHTGASV